MQKIKENSQLNNKGFTLIEMIVAVSIIAIFTGVVLRFVTTGSNLFRNTSNTAKVQMETQETFDKIEDIIIDANRRLSYGETSHIFQVSSFDEQVARKSSGTAKLAALKAASSAGNSTSEDENVRDYIIWNQSEEEIRYIHAEKTDGKWKNSNTSSSDSHGDILATGVTYFQADVSKVISDHIVNFTLRTRKGTKEVETVHSVSLRNNLNFDYSPDEPFDNPTIDPPDNPEPDNPNPGGTDPKPISVLADKTKILIAAGASYDLNKNNTYKVFYNDNSTSSVGNLSWSVNGCTYADISSSGVLSVQASSGTADTGTVTVTVTDTDHNNVYCILEVFIARIDLTLPKKDAVYKVGNAKQLTYTYMEGGMVETGATITTEQKPEGASDYSTDGNFIQNDIGSWKVRASVNLSERTGYDIMYGMVEDVNAFTVVDSVSDIIINGDAAIDALVAGRTYDCMTTIQYGFNWRPVPDNILWDKDSKMRWGIEGNTDGISIDSEEYADPTVTRKITIADDVRHGFIIFADFMKDNGDGTSIRLHTEREIKVVNGIELSSDSDTTYVYESKDPLYSKGYEMKLLLDVYDINGDNDQLIISDEDGTHVDWYELGSGGKPAFSTDKKSWIYIPSVHNVNQTLQITARLQRMAQKYGIFDSANNYYGEEEKKNVNENFEKSIPVKILEPEFTARIVPDKDETIEPETTKEIYLELSDKDGNAIERNVTWSVQNGSTGHLSVRETKTGSGQKTIFSADKPGTYTITASYYTVPGMSHSVTKTITVRKPEVNLTLHGSKTGYNGDTGNYWLEANVDGKTASNLQVTWTTDRANVNKSTSETGETGMVQVKFDDYASSCKITASVKVAGENIEISENITLQKHEYTMAVTVVDPETNKTIDSCIPGKTVKFVVHVYYDGNESDNCQVIWTTWGKDFRISGNSAIYTIGSGENSLSFQIQATSGNKTQYAQVQFDKDGIRFTSKW